MKNKIKLYIVDPSDTVISKLEEIFFSEPSSMIKVIGHSQRFSNCMEDFEFTRQADVFLISVYLPDKTGIELMTQLKKINNKAKFIVTVIPNTRNLIDEALEKGADGYLQKPFVPRKLVNMIYDMFGVEEEEEEGQEDFSSAKEYEDDDLKAYYGKNNYEEEREMLDEDEEEEESFYDEDEELERLLRGDDEIEIKEFSMEDEEDLEKEFLLEEEKIEAKDNKREILDMFEGIANGANIFRKSIEEYDKPNIVCVFSSAKSAGKTTTLVNVAAAIKKHSEYNPRICILDLNLLYPAVTFKFLQDDLSFGSKDIYDIVADLEDLNEEFLDKALIVHEPTKIKILNTPFEYIGNYNKINGEKLQNLITQLRDYFDLILVDTSGNIKDDTTSVPLTYSDKNVILFESDLASLLHTRKFIEIIQLIERTFDKKILKNSYFILNRFNPQSGLNLENVRGTIFNIEGTEINVPLVIPDEPAVTKLSNSGRFIVDSKTEAKERIMELAELIYPFYPEDEEYDTMKTQKNNYEDQTIMQFLKNKFKKK